MTLHPPNVDRFFASGTERGLYGRRRITFRVLGDPQTQGSMKSFPVRKKDGGIYTVTTHSNPNLKQWRHRIASEAQRAIERLADPPFVVFEGPVALTATFYLSRPKSLPKRIVVPLTRDLDKMVRAVKDALTGVIYRDDGQVADLLARKRYADPTSPVGVDVEVEG